MSAPFVFEGIARATPPSGPLHLAIGMFDGVHLGHQAVIASAVHSASRMAGVAGVLTFWPHPSALFNSAKRTRMLMAPVTKHRVLAGLGVDLIIEQPFVPEFAAIPAEEFLATLKRALPSLVAVYVGENWRFGAGRTGDVGLLLRTAEPLGLSVFSAPRVHFNGTPISSTRIREALAGGAIEEANALLGYSYFAEGETQPGRRLGRTIGFPTLNLSWEPEAMPAFGVYRVRVARPDRVRWFPAVANYGLRPTVGEAKEPLLEIHVLGDCPFAYRDRIVVEWLRFQRPEQRFSSIDELREQIAKDREQARAEFFLPRSG